MSFLSNFLIGLGIFGIILSLILRFACKSREWYEAAHATGGRAFLILFIGIIIHFAAK
jgi:hypothetical protein